MYVDDSESEKGTKVHGRVTGHQLPKWCDGEGSTEHLCGLSYILGDEKRENTVRSIFFFFVK